MCVKPRNYKCRNKMNVAARVLTLSKKKGQKEEKYVFLFTEETANVVLSRLCFPCLLMLNLS